MKHLAFSTFDCALNHYIRLSPDTIQALAPLQNKVFAIELTDWSINFFMIPYTNGIQVLSECDQKPDTTITSTLASLVKLSLPGSSTAGINSDLHIQGQVELGQKLHQILTHIEIDWEEHLSHITGDIVAHKACSLLKRFQSETKQAVSKVRGHLTSYLQVESQLLPTASAFGQFKTEVICLRDDVERIEAKINQYLFQQQKKGD